MQFTDSEVLPSADDAATARRVNVMARALADRVCHALAQLPEAKRSRELLVIMTATIEPA